MFQLKPLTRSSVSAALEKAERYRLLNEPVEAESICRDVLEVDPENQAALVNLVLSLTDQFAFGLTEHVQQAKAVAARLQSPYERAYYSGIIYERAAKAHHRRATPAAGNFAYELLRQAMSDFEAAEQQRPAGNDDALLRWNACARLIMRHPELKPDDRTDDILELE